MKEEFAGSGASPAQKPAPQKKPSGRMSVASRILLCILIAAVLFIITMFISPTCRERVRERFAPAVAPVQQEAPVQKQKSPAPAADTTPVQVAPAPPEEAGDFYVVQVKDDLVSISEKKLGDSKRWIDIFNANRDIIKNPTLIFPGQKLKMPAARAADVR